MQILEPEHQLGEIIPNIATMLQRSVKHFGSNIAYQEKRDGKYEGISWNDFHQNIENIAFNLSQCGFSEGDKMVLFSRNRLEMLEMELAVMASGGIAVPIFANFIQETAELLIKHSDAKFLTVEGERQLNNLAGNEHVRSLQQIFVFDNIVDNRFPELSPFKELLKEKTAPDFTLNFDANPDDICLDMYTSGTMGTPKCVQLTHKNILSQQAALSIVWQVDTNDRFLSYLPWHHSFGGILEIFNALYNGCVFSLESSYGRDPVEIMENWKQIQPTVFFSVPKVYKALVDLTKEDKEAEKLFFHPDLKFIFTAAASLPKNISDEFEKRNIAVIEGWGLTETSPCCTTTDPKLKREAGVVGKSMPGTTVAIAHDGEILVKGPNVMPGYYKNDEANKGIFTEDGWYRTGDVGEITETGLKLLARKDRIFKLLNAEKVIPTELERDITGKCHFISYALVEGSGKSYPVALLFPNRTFLERPDTKEGLDIVDCICPNNINELSNCLKKCLHEVNTGLKQKFARIKAAMLIDDELSIEDKTLTPSLKLAPNSVKNVYKAHIKQLYGNSASIEEDVFMIYLEG